MMLLESGRIDIFSQTENLRRDKEQISNAVTNDWEMVSMTFGLGWKKASLRSEFKDVQMSFKAELV